ncbi:MAG: pit accessory protein [Verrucomicrobia bacterium]|nr:pit accessory protein [Verrucomicrobiota bacterium]
MTSLQSLLGKDDQFFDLLAASAAEACDSVRALGQMVAAPAEVRTLDVFVASRRKDKIITHQIGDLLCTTVVTSFEGDDIEAIAEALYKIPKTAEKVAERFLIAPALAQGLDISPQIALLEQATDIVLAMTRQLKGGLSLAAAREHNERLQQLEGEADKVMVDMLRVMYASTMEGKQVVFAKDLLELLEDVADRCRDAGLLLMRIVMKSA